MIQSGGFWIWLLFAVVVFWILPARIRYGFLAAASFAYLVTLDTVSVLSLLAWSVAYYVSVPLVRRGGQYGFLLPTLIVGVLCYLAYFKYIPPLVAALGAGPASGMFIPLGVSYYTFKLIHYGVEYGRGNIKERSLPRYLCWLYLFPTFTAGPIERFDHFLSRCVEKPSTEIFVDGATRIIHGLAKKFVIGGMVIAPLMGRYDSIETLVNALSALPVYKIWAYLVLAYLSIYMDFSAYSDIAIGSSRLFGLTIMENFNLPVLASDIGNFWKRWHMSLAAWCQAYVYMPMIGLTRNPYLAVFATFLVIGLWHAGSLNYVLWGLYHGAGVSIYLSWARFRRTHRFRFPENVPILRHCGVPVTFMYVAVSFTFTLTHQHGGVPAAIAILAKLVGANLG